MRFIGIISGENKYCFSKIFEVLHSVTGFKNKESECLLSLSFIYYWLKLNKEYKFPNFKFEGV